MASHTWLVRCPPSLCHSPGDPLTCACSVDVGSGVGKAVVAVAMITPARAVGLEIVAERAERAATGLAEALDRGK